ncbi:MAG TPA: thioredoxin domain-containing protein [Acidobacteriaceae bacterium]|nr:thioredoxin domain-containing protein [Acidobacteriaceae bacterium]
MLISSRLATLLLASFLASFGCHAQTPAATPAGTRLDTGATLPPAVAYRVEILLRGKAQLPPGSTISIGAVEPSDIPGFHTINVTVTAADKSSHPIKFLLSDDGKTVGQFIKYDISADPRTMISDAGRPFRGGPSSAPVVIVNFDDLECPFCARFHDSLFPAITQRYGDKVHIVYRDFPLDQHPWAMRASVDVNCLAAQSPTGYWNLVDYIHHNGEDIGSDPNAKPDPAKPDAPRHTLDRANAQLDKLTREQGAQQKVDAVKLDACIAKQDTAAIEASKQLGTTLNVESTPTYFINGEKYEGALPLDYVFGQIDDALRAQGTTPPPPYVAPAPPAAPAASAPTRPGN